MAVSDVHVQREGEMNTVNRSSGQVRIRSFVRSIPCLPTCFSMERRCIRLYMTIPEVTGEDGGSACSPATAGVDD